MGACTSGVVEDEKLYSQHIMGIIDSNKVYHDHFGVAPGYCIVRENWRYPHGQVIKLRKYPRDANGFTYPRKHFEGYFYLRCLHHDPVPCFCGATDLQD